LATTPVYAQDSVEEELAELERQLDQLAATIDQGTQSDVNRFNELSDKIDALQQKHAEKSVPENRRSLSTSDRKTLNEKTEGVRHINYSASWHMGYPESYQPDKGWVGITGTRSELKLSGWAQAAIFQDWQANLIDDQQEFSSGNIVVPTVNRKSGGIDARSSRIFFETRTLLDSGTAITTFFMMDGGGGSAPGGFVPRVRQFWAAANNLSFGWMAGSFSNGLMWPAYMDRGAPGNFPLIQTPTIRYSWGIDKASKLHLLTMSFEQGTHQIENADSKTVAPDVVLRYDFKPSWGNLMIAGIARQFNAENTISTATDTTWVSGLTFTGTAKLFPSRRDQFKWAVMVGDGTAGIGWDTVFSPNDAYFNDTTGEIETLGASSWFLGYDAYWTQKWATTIWASYVDIDNSGTARPTDSFANTVTGVVALRYNPLPQLWLHVEYMYGERENWDGQMGKNNRLNLVFRYSFNR
jgi:hypothetical protein